MKRRGGERSRLGRLKQRSLLGFTWKARVQEACQARNCTVVVVCGSTTVLLVDFSVSERLSIGIQWEHVFVFVRLHTFLGKFQTEVLPSVIQTLHVK